MNHKLSKRAKLYIANGIAFLCCIALTLFEWYAFYTYPPFVKYIFVQCLFTFFSLIIYYLSIIADAFSHKNRKSEEDKAASKNGDKNSDTHK